MFLELPWASVFRIMELFRFSTWFMWIPWLYVFYIVLPYSAWRAHEKSKMQSLTGLGVGPGTGWTMLVLVSPCLRGFCTQPIAQRHTVALTEVSAGFGKACLQDVSVFGRFAVCFALATFLPLALSNCPLSESEQQSANIALCTTLMWSGWCGLKSARSQR